MDAERAATRARPRRWREILTDALAQQEVISVRSMSSAICVAHPMRAEITAARRGGQHAGEQRNEQAAIGAARRASGGCWRHDRPRIASKEDR
jgi:hypothetical protein